MKKTLKIALAAIVLFLAPAAASAAGGLFISQVQITGGTGRTAEDFVEIFNPNPFPVGLDGYRLVKIAAGATSTETSIKSWTSDEVIAPFGFYLWANSSNSSLPVAADAATSATLSEDNGLAIRQGPLISGHLVDGVSWGSAENIFRNVSAANPKAGESLVRQDLASASSAFVIASSSPRNSSSTPFFPAGPVPVSDAATSSDSSLSGGGVLATSTPASETRSNISGGFSYLTVSDQVKIMAILPNPQGEDAGQEQFRLENQGGQPVNVEGWFLGDRTDSGIKGNAYKMPAAIIEPGGNALFSIPKGHFALNNTGGDSLNLYYSDKSLADSVSYEGEAPEGKFYKKTGLAWGWEGSGDAAEGRQDRAGELRPPAEIFISEFMPDLPGADEGKEWIELFNAGAAAVSLKGFVLDDEGKSGSPGPSAWTLEEGYSIPPKGYLALTVPEDKFTLDNSGGDAVRLFAPDGRLADSASYQKPEEGKSYAKTGEGGWQWLFPTPGQENSLALAGYKLVFSELLPNPEKNSEEFIELLNTGSEDVPLRGLVLHIGKSSRILDSDDVLKPAGFAVIFEDELPVKLRNGGQSVRLTDMLGRQLAEAKYDKAEAGHSFALGPNGQYFWTGQPTPGSENIFVLGSSAAEADAAVKNASAKEGVNYQKLYQSVSKANRELAEKVDRLEKMLGRLEDSLRQESAGVFVPEAMAASVSPEPEESGPSQGLAYLAIVAGSLAGLLVLGWLLSQTQKEKQKEKT